MQIRQLCQLDAIMDAIAARNGRCRYCDRTHPAGQCKAPRNWTDSEPARHSEYAIMQANEAGSERAYNEQLDREARREWVRSIKP
jgi:hypothetical protein